MQNNSENLILRILEQLWQSFDW